MKRGARGAPVRRVRDELPARRAAGRAARIWSEPAREREELGVLLDRFLEAVPAREPTEEEIVAMQARLEQQPPLLVLRLRRALRREAVVEALVSQLGLDPAKSGKVGGYYADLEVGILDPEPVDRRVWDVLAEVLKANVRALAGLRPEPPAAVAAAYHREPTPALLERTRQRSAGCDAGGAG